MDQKEQSRIGDDNDNFYMVLPSNGCETTQPTNTANSYINNWQQTIRLKGRWEVALVDFSFNSFSTVVQDLFVESEGEVCKILKYNVEYEGKQVGTTKIDGITSFSVSSSKRFIITCKNFPFYITFSKLWNLFGFKEQMTYSASESCESDNPINEFIKFNDEITIQTSELIVGIKGVIFENLILKPTFIEMASYLREKLSSLVENLIIDQNGYVSFCVKKKYQRISFDEKLSKILGFNEPMNCYYLNGQVYKGECKVKLSDLNHQVFIYCSCIEPILVGDVMVPLMRNVWVQFTEIGQIVHQDIIRPMYLRVTGNNINNIEIELRNDAGELIKFPPGSKTCITLHFRINKRK
jgi:hypothetical protein